MEKYKNTEELVAARGKQYGHPSKNFSDIAKGWSVLFGVEVTAHQVALAMIWFKVCREANGQHSDDNLDDIKGYALCHSMIPWDVEA